MEQSAGLCGLRCIEQGVLLLGYGRGCFGWLFLKTRIALGCIRSLGPLNLIWFLQASSGLSPPASKENLTNNVERRDNVLAEGED